MTQVLISGFTNSGKSPAFDSNTNGDSVSLMVRTAHYLMLAGTTYLGAVTIWETGKDDDQGAS